MQTVPYRREQGLYEFRFVSPISPESMCWKRTFIEITWKRIVGNENITCLIILGSVLRDIAFILDKLMIFKNIKNLHLAWLNLDESVCISIPY